MISTPVLSEDGLNRYPHVFLGPLCRNRRNTIVVFAHGVESFKTYVQGCGGTSKVSTGDTERLLGEYD